jgi:hypothetical protein
MKTHTYPIGDLKEKTITKKEQLRHWGLFLKSERITFGGIDRW